MHTSVVSKENSSVSQTESKSPTSRMLSQTASIKLSFVNIVLTILIVWLHVSSYYDLPESVGNIAIISVPCFFAISSYLYFISFNFEDVFGCYKSKLRTRVKSLLIPFIIFNILGLIFSLIAYKVHPTDYNPIEELTLSRIPMLLYRSQFNGPLWYMRALFEFVIFAPVIGWILSRHKYSLLIVLPFYFICGTISYFSFLHWMIPICLGAYLAIYGYNFLTYISPTTIACAVLTVILISKLSISNSLVNRLAKSSFAVYLVFVNPNILSSYGNQFSILHHHYTGVMYWVITILIVLALYALVSMTDTARIYFYNRLCHLYLSNKTSCFNE